MAENDNWFGQGFSSVREQAKRLDEIRNQVYIPTLIMKDTDGEVDITFLTAEPITFYEHFVKNKGAAFTCTGDPSCPLCAMGNKASFKGAYLVIDHREQNWVDKKTGEPKHSKDTVKIMKHGIRALQVLDRKNTKKGLLNFSWTMTRTGSGNDTQYDFEPIEKVPFIMPEKLPDLREALKPRDRAYILRVLSQAGLGNPGNAPTTHVAPDYDDEAGINWDQQ